VGRISLGRIEQSLAVIPAPEPPDRVRRPSAGTTFSVDERRQLSKKLRSFLDRLGCLSLRSAFASI
jgi:hypothetical protein